MVLKEISHTTIELLIDKGTTLTSDEVVAKIDLDALGVTGYVIEGLYSDAEYATAFDFSKAVDANTNIYVKLVEEEKDPQPPVEELPEQEPSDEEKDETPATGVANYIGIAIAVIAVSSIVIISLKRKMHKNQY